MRRNIAKDIMGSDGTELAGKRVVLCVSGSVAAYKAIELARLLMRHGADVRCVLSAAATRLIKPEYFTWATGNAAITRLTGKLEHIDLADYGRSDFVVVYPATANTIGKLANGIDDTPVSTLLTVALGSKIPIIACMAMHASMHDNPAVSRNAEFLGSRIEFVEPQMLEGKAKAPEPEDVMRHVLRRFGGSRVLAGKRALVVAGPTRERIDAVRSVVSESTGQTGVLLADLLLRSGASVTMVYGPACEEPPERARVIRVESAAEMESAVRKELRRKIDIVIMAAAVSDYAPVPLRSKMKSSQKDVTIRMKPTRKIINIIKRVRPGVFLVGFKAESGSSRTKLVAAAKKKIAESHADMVVANDISARPKMSTVIVDARGRIVESRPKRADVRARFIMRQIETRVNSSA